MDAPAATEYAAWIGRTERRHDVVTAGSLDRLSATLDRDDEPHGDGMPAVPLAHWILFLPDAPQAELGRDGHPTRGGFLPPVHHLPRRMWAGGRLQFHAPLRVGMRLVRTSTIDAVTARQGASGELVFVTVRHEVAEEGREAVLLREEHDIVYRGVSAPAVKPAARAEAGAWRRQVVPDAVMLFRYSALTFNGHRIHYDRGYVTGTEGYPGLVVHGPLTATLLLDLVRREMPGAQIIRFAFRAHSPLFDGAPLHLNATPPDAEGRVALWATNAEGGLAMRADAWIG